MKYLLLTVVAGIMSFFVFGLSSVDAIVQRTVSGEKKVITANSGSSIVNKESAALKIKRQALLRSQKLIKAKIALFQKRIDALQKMIDAKKTKNLPTTLLDKQMKGLMDTFNKAQTTASELQKKIDATASGVINKI